MAFIAWLSLVAYFALLFGLFGLAGSMPAEDR